MGRPPKRSVEAKLKIVLSVLSGEDSQAEAARRHGVSVTSVAKWREQSAGLGVWLQAREHSPPFRPKVRRQ